MAEDIPDGVHIDLDEKIYFGLDALGSTDIKDLYQLAEGWWWKSRHNPDRAPATSDAMNFGSALHALLLEGGRLFEERFAVQPDPRTFPDLLRSGDDIKRRLGEMGIKAPSKLNKGELVDFMLQADPRANVWDDIVASFEDSIGDRRIITATQDRSLRIMAESVLDSPDVGGLFAHNENSLPLSEVSVIYTTAQGIRRRARLDLLTPATTFDLKAIGVWDGKPLEYAIGDRIAKAGYDIQRTDYDDARAEAYIAISEGRVFGATADVRRWLARFPVEAPNWNWTWGFYQVPDAAKGRAPVFFPLEDQAESLYHIRGRGKKAQALDLYARCCAEFGLDRPWKKVERLHFTDKRIAEIFAEPGQKLPVVYPPKWYLDEDAPRGEGEA